MTLALLTAGAFLAGIATGVAAMVYAGRHSSRALRNAIADARDNRRRVDELASRVASTARRP
jgi:hypothetical protein